MTHKLDGYRLVVQEICAYKETVTTRSLAGSPSVRALSRTFEDNAKLIVA
jgi:hypothetical protein